MITLQFLLALIIWVTFKALFTAYWSSAVYTTCGSWRWSKFKKSMRKQLTVD